MTDHKKLKIQIPSPDALAYRINEAHLLGGPCKTKIYALAKRGILKLIHIDGRTLIEGNSLRNLLMNGTDGA
jgi:hypothetical protein